MTNRINLRLNQIQHFIVGVWFLFNLKRYSTYCALVSHGLSEKEAFYQAI